MGVLCRVAEYALGLRTWATEISEERKQQSRESSSLLRPCIIWKMEGSLGARVALLAFTLKAGKMEGKGIFLARNKIMTLDLHSIKCLSETSP